MSDVLIPNKPFCRLSLVEVNQANISLVVSKRQTLLEESINKKEQSNCPNTSVDLSISPSKEATTYHDDSGYTGLDSTPRPYRRSNLHHKVKKPRFNNSTLPMYSYSTAEIIHYIMVIVMAASLCFGILVGTMVRERNNMKYQAIECQDGERPDHHG